MNKKIKDHQSCDFGMTKFNQTKRDKEAIKRIREFEKLSSEPVISEEATTSSDTQKPSAPQNLRVTAVAATSISLAWNASTDNVAVAGYKVYFKKSGGHTYAITTTGLTANFQKLDTNTLYYFYVKAFDAAKNLSDASATVSATTGTPPPPPPPPTGVAVIYVDFNGGVVSGTSWNTSGDITYDVSGLTLTEEQTIIDGMTQDYAKYNALVTSDKSIYDAADPSKRTWAIVTESYEWYCGTTPCAGGVGFVGSMFWGSKTPCWIFSSALSYSTKYIRDAATHEVGHTIGLYHQSVYDASCTKTAEYNPGNSTCDCAPNMGVAYNRTYNQWWVGPNSQSCTTIQDDDKVITSKVGLK